jgi:hypothetical protein
MPRPSANRAKFTQPMYSLDANRDVRSLLKHRTDICGEINRLDPLARSMIDVHRIRRARGDFVWIEPGDTPCDDRPRVRVGGSFAGDVSSIELGDGGVEVVGVKCNNRCDPLVSIDLVDAKPESVDGPVI